MKTYKLYREGFTDSEWYELIQKAEMLPVYCDCFDRNGEISKDYEKAFNCDVYELKHDSLLISDFDVWDMVKLDVLGVTNELYDDIDAFLGDNGFFNSFGDFHLEIKGDGDGLGFIVDLFDGEGCELLDTQCFWFEDFEM
jgi:hypothetical protein